MLASLHRIRVVLAGTGLHAGVLIALGGCAGMPAPPVDLTAPVSFRSLASAPPVRDGRPAFRQAFCSLLREEGLAASGDTDCGRWLWRLSDEASADADRAVAAARPDRLEVVIVTGAFSECVDEASRPFAAGSERLIAAGARVRTVVVSGRSGTAYNARQIAAAVSAVAFDATRKVILLGYSKGGLDILRFLTDFPDLAARVDAVVAVASPLFGTPLADLAEPAYATLAAKLPYEKCPPGDGEVIASLRPDAAMQWLDANPLPTSVRFYSLVAFTTREHVARALVPFWKHLGGPGVRNDGQVVAIDAVIPGSTLLGFANADHWGVAQTIERVHPTLVGRRDPARFPLEQLFVAIVTVVAADPGAAPLRSELDRAQEQSRQGEAAGVPVRQQ